jgi:ribonuclease BN (tRNA processing enzyme)
MKLTIVGCSGSYPGPDSAASCYLLEEPYQGRTFRIVLDMGNGALGALQRYGDINDIDAILITHLHGDHCLDLCSYYVARRYHPDGPLAPVPVYGPEGAAERMACAGDLPVDPGMNQEFELARDADVLLCESSFVEGEDNPPNLHMTGREAAEHAKSANVGRLLLTHIPPWHERSRVLADAVAAWDGPIELVSAGESYEI